MLKISVSGIRGIWGEDLTPQSILSFTKAFAHCIIAQKGSVQPLTIVIGADTRPTSPVFKAMVCSFLQTFGFNVIDLGVMATPLVLFAVRTLKADGGIVLTASHNPLEWNAFKCVTHEGLFFNAEQMKILEEYHSKNLDISFSYQNIGSLKVDRSFIDRYLEFVLPYFNVSAIKNSNIKVLADVINGTASEFFPILMQYLGLEYSILHMDTHKAFERGAEPKPENLKALEQKVLERKAQVGFAFDPDGDRLALVDENGHTMGENWTLVIAYYCFLKLHQPQNKETIINLSTSLLIDQVAQKFHTQVHRVPVGEINITQALLKNNIPFGGEGNGGVIFTPLNPCRDSIIAILFILEYLAVEKTTLATLIKEFNIPTSINLSIPAHQVLDKQIIKTKLFQLAKDVNLINPVCDEQDGLRLAYTDGWIQVRASNTEPIVRIMGESYQTEIQSKIVESIKSWF